VVNGAEDRRIVALRDDIHRTVQRNASMTGVAVGRVVACSVILAAGIVLSLAFQEYTLPGAAGMLFVAGMLARLIHIYGRVEVLRDRMRCLTSAEREQVLALFLADRSPEAREVVALLEQMLDPRKEIAPAAPGARDNETSPAERAT